ncbi:MAG: low temperature requirement protein A [Cyanobacteria bacterium P01_D01_bin.105]
MTLPKKNYFSSLVARDRHEPHRAATQLELLFDLVVVIAIATSAHGLTHELSEGHFAMGIIKFLLAFFILWWPWNLFTWFASGFDNDDAAYRVNVMVMMIGIMLVAASIPTIFQGGAIVYGFIGYLILRAAAAVLWLRIKDKSPQLKVTVQRNVIGQIIIQSFWAYIVFMTEPWSMIFVVLVAIAIAAELFVPWYARQAKNTPWHRHHVIERFGLLNIIVLGEILLSSVHAIEASTSGSFNFSLMVLAIGSAAISFTMWWLYFCEAEHLESVENKRTFVWAYGHFVVFASGAATGAGFNLMVDVLNSTHSSEEHLSLAAASWAVTVPLALYVVGLWLVRDRYQLNNLHSSCLLFFAVLICLSALLPYQPIPSLVLLVACLSFRLGVANNSEAKLKSQE